MKYLSSLLIEKAQAFQIQCGKTVYDVKVECGGAKNCIDSEKLGVEHISCLILYFIGAFFLIVLFATVIFTIIGAYGYLTAYGNEEKAQKAKTTIFWSIAGFIVALLARVLVGELIKLVGGPT